MIVLIVLVVAVVGFFATYAWDRLRSRRRLRLAERATLDARVRAGGTDGMRNPIAAEAVLREGYRPDGGAAGPFA